MPEQRPSFEVNFDGIIGPTHNYGGLSYGNIASTSHKNLISNPKKAALQGLAKMRTLMRLGVKQAVLPPHERPYLPFLHSIGYQGPSDEVIKRVWKESPELLTACYSSASMWTANAATISPSSDSADKKVHITPANLISNLHRSIEAETTGQILKKIFPSSHFHHHAPLPPCSEFADEGAANHNRFCPQFNALGLQLFVYGRHALEKNAHIPSSFPARQTFEASQAIARLHQIPARQTIFAQQNPAAIDEGVFHNDVISVGNQNLFFYHEDAFLNTSEVISQLSRKYIDLFQNELYLIEVPSVAISLREAVKTYLFNSQLVTLPNQTMALIAPIECQLSKSVSLYLKELLKRDNNPIKQVIFMNLDESMHNGGGPACLRLRVVLNQEEFAAVHQPVILSESLYEQLTVWVNSYYRDRIRPEDLADPNLLLETHEALDALTRVLKLEGLYSFQRR